MRNAALALLLLAAACGGGDDGTGDDTTDAPEPDAGDLPACTGEAYDPCEDTTDWTDCQDGMECRLFTMQGFTICTPSCDAENPCPDDEDGNPVDCNQMGRCRADAPSSCALP